MNETTIRKAYEIAKQQYADVGIDTEEALRQLARQEVSMHCWQGDDVTGLEQVRGGVSGGIMATGQYPGKPRSGDELRSDMQMAMSLLPGRQRINLHASYAETRGETVDRDAYETRHFDRWLDWAKKEGVALDFNPTFFGHPMAADDLTLSHPDESVRRFWIDHARQARKIAFEMAEELQKDSVCNVWVQDGLKDMPADRLSYRLRLLESLDEIFAEAYPANRLQDAVESKLFGVGVESFTVGSHEFYLNYLARARGKGQDNLLLTLDMGHFHPTETIADKISAVLAFHPGLLVHVSRPVKWDSDHVVVTDEALLEVMREIKRADGFGQVRLATDFFDGSINRVAAWVIGIRATQKAILAALLEPTQQIRQAERDKDYTRRLALMEEARHLPCQAVWNMHCLRENVPVAADYLKPISDYEENVLSQRQ